jgi:hypothetical protein
MFLYLAQSGGTVLLPDAVDVRDGQVDGDVEFLDEHGSVIARFRRADLLLYSKENVRGMGELQPESEGSNCLPA